MGEIQKIPQDVCIADPEVIDQMSDDMVELSRKMSRSTESMIGLREIAEDVHKKNSEYLLQREKTMKALRKLSTEL